MQEQKLDDGLGREVAVDLCLHCQSFWFDGRESLRLSAAATLTLFRIIGEGTNAATPIDRDNVECPRCQSLLRLTRDRQRATRFEWQAVGTQGLVGASVSAFTRLFVSTEE